MPVPTIELLTPQHVCKRFDCGKDWLNQYIRNHALKNQQNGYGRTYVVPRIDGGSNGPAGYFTLSMGAVSFQNLPPSLAKGMPKYPMPVTLMGCLAVSSDMQGQGLGSYMLIEAMRRMIQASAVVATRAMEVHAIDDDAAKWYAGYGFAPFLDHPRHMFLPFDTVAEIVAKS